MWERLSQGQIHIEFDSHRVLPRLKTGFIHKAEQSVPNMQSGSHCSDIALNTHQKKEHLRETHAQSVAYVAICISMPLLTLHALTVHPALISQSPTVRTGMHERFVRICAVHAFRAICLELGL